MSTRPITQVDDTYAYPCGCVAQGTPTRIIEACGNAYCPNYPVARSEKKDLEAAGIKIRGRT